MNIKEKLKEMIVIIISFLINLIIFSPFIIIIYFFYILFNNSCNYSWELIYDDKIMCSKIEKINELNELKLKNDKYKVINNQLDKIEKELNE